MNGPIQAASAIPYSTQPSREVRAPVIHLPLWLRAVFIVVAGMTLANVAARVLGQYVALPPSPFAPFADVFPRQPRSAVEARGFSCSVRHNGADPGLWDEYCILKLANGAFSSVGVVVSNDTIHQISFAIRDNALRLGDLVALWGRPDAHEYGQSAYFFWPSSGVMAAANPYVGQFSLFLPVRSIYIANTRV